jgi:hypothetical protein
MAALFEAYDKFMLDWEPFFYNNSIKAWQFLRQYTFKSICIALACFLVDILWRIFRYPWAKYKDWQTYKLYLQRYSTYNVECEIGKQYPKKSYPSFVLYRIADDMHIIRDAGTMHYNYLKSFISFDYLPFQFVALAKKVLSDFRYDRSISLRLFTKLFRLENVFTTKHMAFRNDMRQTIHKTLKPERNYFESTLDFTMKLLEEKKEGKDASLIILHDIYCVFKRWNLLEVLYRTWTWFNGWSH